MHEALQKFDARWDFGLLQEADRITTGMGWQAYGPEGSFVPRIIVSSRWREGVARWRREGRQWVAISLESPNLTTPLILISAHIPHQGRPFDDAQAAWDEISSALDERPHRLQGAVIIMGCDANTQACALHEDAWWGPEGDMPAAEWGERQQAMYELCAAHDVRLANTYVPNAWTHEGAVGQQRQIDFVGHGRGLEVTDVETVQKFNLPSDHVPVMIKGRLRAKRQRRTGRKNKRVYVGWEPADEEAETKFRALLEEMPKECTLPEIAGRLTEAAGRVEHITARQKYRKTHRECLEGPAVAALRAEMDRAADDWEEFKKARRRWYRARRKELKEHRKNRFAENAMTMMKGAGRQTQIAKVLEDKRGRQVEDKAEWPQVLEEHFAEQWRDAEEDAKGRVHALKSMMRAQQLDGDLPRARVRSADVEVAIWKARRGRAGGDDEVTWELLKAAPASVIDVLRTRFEERINSTDPDDLQEWESVSTVLLNKIPKPKRPGELRPITLTAVIQRLYLKVVTAMATRESSKPAVAQHGFVKGGQTMEVGASIATIIHKAKRWQKRVAIAKADFAKAFDSIPHSLMDDAMKSRGVSLPLRKAVIQELTTTRTTITYGGESTKEIPMDRGAVQGGTATPWLWNMVVDYVLRPVVRKWEAQEKGVMLDGWPDSDGGVGMDREQWVTNYFWADDFFILAEGAEQLREMLQDVVEAIRRAGMSLKESSLQWMMAGHVTAEAHDLQVGGHTFKATGALNVLGMHISQTADPDAAIRHRLRMGDKAWAARRAQFMCRKVPLHTRIGRFQTCLHPVVLYGSGMWPPQQRHWDLMNAWQSRKLRAMAGGRKTDGESWPAFIRRLNAKAREAAVRAQVGPLAWEQASQYHSWMGHCARDRGAAGSTMLWRNAEWRNRMDSMAMPSTAGVGRPRVEAEGPLVEYYGSSWPNRAADRKEWADLRAPFVHSIACQLARPAMRGWAAEVLAAS